MRVLVTGGRGFVGSHLVTRLTAEGDEAIAPSHAELDLVDGDAVTRAVAEAAPDAIVHAAIWNDPAGLRADRRRGWAQYVGATRHVVDAAGEVPVLLVSTDWVFAGDGGGPYGEDDPPCPINAYGFLKAACELVVAERARHGIVARICGVQGPPGPGAAPEQDAGFGNLAAALVQTLRAGETFTVWTGAAVNATSTPTLASDLAGMIRGALVIATGEPGSLPPVLHCCGAEAIDRLAFAHRVAAAFELDPALIRSGPAPAEALADAPVPVDTPLRAEATAAALRITLPDLDATLGRLRAELEPA